MFASFEWQFRQIISEHATKVNEEFSKDQIPRMSLYKKFYKDFKKKKKKKKKKWVFKTGNKNRINQLTSATKYYVF